MKHEPLGKAATSSWSLNTRATGAETCGGARASATTDLPWLVQTSKSDLLQTVRSEIFAAVVSFTMQGPGKVLKPDALLWASSFLVGENPKDLAIGI